MSRKSKKTEEVEMVEKKPSAGGTADGLNDSDNTNLSTINPTIKTRKNQEKKDNRRRTNVFATLVYPDSAPTDWMEKLRDTHVTAFISPLHDKDTNPDKTQKKPHYHVMMIFDSVKNFDTQVKPIFDSFGGVGREEVLSQRGYARYLCHMDNPEKYQYDREEVQELSGACYAAAITLPTDDIGAVEEMIDFIEKNDIYSFRQLFMWCKDNQKDWFRLLASSKTYIIKEYLKSRYWDLENEEKLNMLKRSREISLQNESED